jgi:hypothetical protein
MQAGSARPVGDSSTKLVLDIAPGCQVPRGRADPWIAATHPVGAWAALCGPVRANQGHPVRRGVADCVRMKLWVGSTACAIQARPMLGWCGRSGCVPRSRHGSWSCAGSTGLRRPCREAIDVLAEQRPALGRPLVDRLKGSLCHNVKGLRRGHRSADDLRVRSDARGDLPGGR